MRLRTASLIVLSVIAVGVFGVRSAEALTLVPPSLEYSTVKGQTIEGKVKLLNNENRSLVLTPSTSNFGAKDESGEPDFSFDAPLADLASWITIEPQQLTLEPGETKEVPFKIVIPVDAEPGGHYAGIFFASGGSASSGGQIGVQSKLGTLVILTIEGNIREQAAITSVTLDGSTRVSRPPVNFDIRIANSGNVHVKPKGKVTILNMFGGEVETISLPQDKNILPGQTRLFEVAWVKKSADRPSGNFFSEIGAEFSNFALGTYTASIEATYGQTDKTMVGNVKFTIIPWRAVTVVVLGLIILILALTVGMKSYNRMVIRKAQTAITQATPPEKKK